MAIQKSKNEEEACQKMKISESDEEGEEHVIRRRKRAGGGATV